MDGNNSVQFSRRDWKSGGHVQAGGRRRCRSCSMDGNELAHEAFRKSQGFLATSGRHARCSLVVERTHTHGSAQTYAFDLILFFRFYYYRFATNTNI